MRFNKIETIRRLLSAAIAECENSQLAGVKKSMAKVVMEINMLEDGLRNKKNNSNSRDKPKIKVEDPLGALSGIDRMIADEVDKLSKPEGGVISE